MSTVKVPTVAVDLERTKYRYSGLGQYCLFLGKALLESKADLNFQYFCRPSVPEFSEKVSIQNPSEWSRWLGVNARSVDLWHSTWQESNYLPRDKTAVVMTIHDLNFIHDSSESKIKKKLARIQRSLDRSSYVTTISEYTAQLVKKHLNVEVPLEVIHNGLTMDSSTEATAIDSLRFSKGDFHLSLGVFLPKKNVHSLVEMMRVLPNENLVIAGGLGDINYLKRLENLVSDYNLSSRVQFVGEVGAKQKKWLYESAKSFLFPSTQEGFGLPVVEAMSCGTPVFCSNLTSLPEIGGDVAFYWDGFEPNQMADRLMSGLKTIAADQSFGDKLKSNAQRFCWADSAQKYIEVYQRVLAGL